MKPIILLDIDGTVLQWQANLAFYCHEQGIKSDYALQMLLSEDFVEPSKLFGVSSRLAESYIHDYNMSKYCRTLPAYRDALEFIKKHKAKYDFIAVTKFSKDPEALANRMYNLQTLFPDAFKDIYSCDFSESKTDILEEIRKAYGTDVRMFVDDQASNIDAADKVFKGTIELVLLSREGKASYPLFCDHIHVESLMDIDVVDNSLPF